MGAMDLDEAVMRAKVAALALSDDATRRRVICGLVGHSRVVDEEGDARDWRVCCARCGSVVDRARESELPDEGNRMFHLVRFEESAAVFRQHAGCAICAANIRTLTWRDLWEVQLGQTDGRTT